MDITFIGAGHLAWHLAPALDNAGYVVKEVFSRTRAHASALTGRLYQAEVKLSLDFSDSPSELFILSVPDDAQRDVVTELVLPENAILVHTSGSMPLSLLELSAASGTGVFFPLQTFHRTKKATFKSVPIFVESSQPEVQTILMGMAKAIGGQGRNASSEDRKALHVASVFASDFSNYMLTLSQDLLRKHNLSFELLKPLVMEAIQKALTAGPEAAQAGPAARGDLETLDQHLQLLENEEMLRAVYQMLSQQLIDRYSEGD